MGTSIVWKDIPGYEGLYQASTDGRIRSTFRYKKVLKPNKQKNGYYSVQLFKNKIGKRILLHRLIALTFIENPYNKAQVNHKDENKQNNCVDNLEWTTAKENMNYGTRTKRQVSKIDYNTNNRKLIARENGKRVSKSVSQYSKTGELINVFDSGKDASRATGINHSHILECCAGKRYKTVGGYVWKYTERGNDLLAFQY